MESSSRSLKCPQCDSQRIRKNGHRRGKQNYRCGQCQRQFIEFYAQRGYSEDVKRICLRMHEYGLGARQVERLTGVCHSTIHSWIRQSREQVKAAEKKH